VAFFGFVLLEYSKMGNSYHLNVFLTEDQGTKILALKDFTGLNLSELTRRLFDYCLQEHRLNDIVPSMSGKMLKEV